jgi:hypothetical protein
MWATGLLPRVLLHLRAIPNVAFSSAPSIGIHSLVDCFSSSNARLLPMSSATIIPPARMRGITVSNSRRMLR